MADRVSLLTALRRTARRELSINLFIAGKAKSIPADAALVLLADEPEGWDWEGTAQRVRTMWPAPLRTRHMPSRPVEPWQATAWHTGSVIRVSPEWMHSVGYAVSL